MRMYRIAAPLPLEEIPLEYGETQVDYMLTEDLIKELDRKFGFKEHLGGGMWGIAYLTNDGKVLKITTDTLEAEAAERLKGDTRGPFAQVYDVQQIAGRDREHGLFYILKDYVKPLDEQMSALFDDYQNLDFSDEEEVEAFRKSFPEECEMFEDYTVDVGNYGFADTMRSDNVGIDSSGQIVSFDPRVHPGGFFGP